MQFGESLRYPTGIHRTKASLPPRQEPPLAVALCTGLRAQCVKEGGAAQAVTEGLCSRH